MARKTKRTQYDPSQTLLEILNDDEIALLGIPGHPGLARMDDDFALNAWDLYGEDWVNHIPTSINYAFSYLFGMVMWHYQLRDIYYCPIRDIHLHGARGSGKTEPIAVMNALWLAFNPGHNWLHTAPSKDQSQKSYDSILRHGRHDPGGRDFAGLFIAHQREAPFPDLIFRRWDDIDPGSEAWFRSMGKPNEPGELVRSFECGRLTCDEALRLQQSDWAIRVVAGCLRGPNHYKMATHPELREQYQELAFAISAEMDSAKREQMEDKKEQFIHKHDLDKQTKMMVYGNVGREAWMWQRYEWGEQHPARRRSATWFSMHNPAFSKQQREDLAQQYEGDEDGLLMEMEAKRPPPSGDAFVAQQIDSIFDADLGAKTKKLADDGVKGYKFVQHERWGLVEYAVPAAPGAIYAAGGDGGTGRVPYRNKWTLFVVRIDKRPFEIVCWKTGNLSRAGQGSIRPWLQAIHEVSVTYPIPAAHLAVDATGTQKGIHEVAWSAPGYAEIWPFTMNQKPGLIHQLQLMLSACLFTGPYIRILDDELSSYTLKEEKDQPQDAVMAMLALGAVVWPYVAHELQPHEQEVEPWYLGQEVVEVPDGREYRDTDRYWRDR